METDLSLIITISLLAFVEWTSFSPFKTFGFYCNDPKLAFKNEGETISVNMLLFTSFVVPYFVFLIVEWSLQNDISANKNLKNTSWLRHAHLWYVRFIHGLCFTFLVTDVVKLIAGEPRPHFLDTCKPLEAVNCTTGQYFPEFTCTNSLLNVQKINDSYKSFPSGHASFSSFTATFLTIYFTKKVRANSLFLLNFLQFLCISWAMLCSISRITDRRHHWWDVLSGSILGLSISIYFCFYRWEHRRCKKLEVEKNRQFESKFMNLNK